MAGQLHWAGPTGLSICWVWTQELRGQCPACGHTAREGLRQDSHAGMGTSESTPFPIRRL